MRRKRWSYLIVSVALAGTLQACGGGTVGAPDTTAPKVTAFTLPASASLTVSVSAFTATDNVAVTGYMVTQSPTPPTANDARWTATAPATVTAAIDGSQTFFPWAKDAAGNVSAVGTPATVNIDANAPVVTAFTLPATSTSLTVSINSFTATDNVAVTGYMITQSTTPPSAGDVGWTATAPATVTAAALGSQTFGPCAKDAAGNVSAVGTPATVTITASVAVAGAGTDTTSAVGADATFTFFPGDYQYNISGFGAGDMLVFQTPAGAPNTLAIVNPSPTDGIVTVQWTPGKFVVTVVLNGLSAAQDQQIVDVATFKAVFGANSIQ